MCFKTYVILCQKPEFASLKIKLSNERIYKAQAYALRRKRGLSENPLSVLRKRLRHCRQRLVFKGVDRIAAECKIYERADNGRSI